MFYFRRRSQRKSKQLPEEKKIEKEEPVREYKVRDLVTNIQIYIHWTFLLRIMKEPLQVSFEKNSFDV